MPRYQHPARQVAVAVACSSTRVKRIHKIHSDTSTSRAKSYLRPPIPDQKTPKEPELLKNGAKLAAGRLTITCRSYVACGLVGFEYCMKELIHANMRSVFSWIAQLNITIKFPIYHLP